MGKLIVILAELYTCSPRPDVIHTYQLLKLLGRDTWRNLLRPSAETNVESAESVGRVGSCGYTLHSTPLVIWYLVVA